MKFYIVDCLVCYNDENAFTVMFTCVVNFCLYLHEILFIFVNVTCK